MTTVSLNDLHAASVTNTGLPNDIPPDLVAQAVKVSRNLRRIVAAYGGVVTSVYRSPAVNARINGSATSPHLRARAGDVTGTPDAMARFTLDAVEGRLSFEDGLRLRTVAVGVNHIHVDFHGVGESGAPRLAAERPWEYAPTGVPHERFIKDAIASRWRGAPMVGAITLSDRAAAEAFTSTTAPTVCFIGTSSRTAADLARGKGSCPAPALPTYYVAPSTPALDIAREALDALYLGFVDATDQEGPADQWRFDAVIAALATSGLPILLTDAQWALWKLALPQGYMIQLTPSANELESLGVRDGHMMHVVHPIHLTANAAVAHGLAHRPQKG